MSTGLSRWGVNARAAGKTIWRWRTASSGPDGSPRRSTGCDDLDALARAFTYAEAHPHRFEASLDHEILREYDMADIADATGGTDLLDRMRVRLKIRILIALGQKEAAQDLRWRTEYGLIETVVHGTIPLLPPDHLPGIDARLATAAQESGPSRRRCPGCGPRTRRRGRTRGGRRSGT